MSTRNDRRHKSNATDLTGLIFGEWVVLHRSPNAARRQAVWFCRCSCGVERDVLARSLASHTSASCGHGSAATMRATFTKHGRYKSREYGVWNSIKNRCYQPSSRHYLRYGGRGIRVCQRWLSSFADFMADMGERPTQKHTVDRIDNDGDYACGKCPECVGNGLAETNCRWATMKEQGNNRSDNRILTANGRSRTLKQWAEETGITSAGIRHRLDKLGWSDEDAINTPLTVKRRPDSTFNGQTKNLTEWSAETGIGRAAIHNRIYKHGWDIEKALTTPARPIKRSSSPSNPESKLD